MSHEDSQIKVLKVTESDTWQLGKGDLEGILTGVGKAGKATP